MSDKMMLVMPEVEKKESSLGPRVKQELVAAAGQ
jgi:hypothetical protein